MVVVMVDFQRLRATPRCNEDNMLHWISGATRYIHIRNENNHNQYEINEKRPKGQQKQVWVDTLTKEFEI